MILRSVRNRGRTITVSAAIRPIPARPQLSSTSRQYCPAAISNTLIAPFTLCSVVSNLGRQVTGALGVHRGGQVAVQQPPAADRRRHHQRGRRHRAARRQAAPGHQRGHRHVAEHDDDAPAVHRVGVPGEQRGAGRGRVLPARGPRGQPAVHREQPAEHQDRVDRVGQRVLGVEQPGREQRGDHGHGVGGRADQPEPPARHVGQGHQQRADRRVDRQHRVVHDHRVAGEPVHRRDQQRIAALVQRGVGEVGGLPAGQDPRRDQVGGLVGVGQRHALPAAEPGPHPDLQQPARRDQQRPPSRHPPGGPVGLDAYGVGPAVGGLGDAGAVPPRRGQAAGRGLARPDEQACQGKCLPRSKDGPGLGPGRRMETTTTRMPRAAAMRVPSDWPFNL